MTQTIERPTDEPAAAGEPAVAGTIDEGAAFETSGFRAPVFKPMFSQASPQYFTPLWLCEALPPIAEHAFGLDGMIPEERPSLNVIDPTCGSAWLLAPFKERGHHVFGVELDARLADVAGKGRRQARHPPG
ncbi:MAG: hypothetical protein JXM73_15145 [Anaerolineae bacterium]|nr:hypothetical protein [Anaerolineae bacterium]